MDIQIGVGSEAEIAQKPTEVISFVGKDGLDGSNPNLLEYVKRDELGDLSWEDMVELAKLGTTIIVGGYIKTQLIDVNAIRISGGLATINDAISQANIAVELALTDFSGTLGALAFENLIEAAKLGTTIIQGGYIKTTLLDVNAIRISGGYALAADTAAAVQAAADALAAANAAQTAAALANALISNIASDNVLSAVEKPAILKEMQGIQSEVPTISAQALKYDISSTAYVNAFSALNTYITPLIAVLTSDSPINGVTFRTYFKNYYDAKVLLLKAISDKAKDLADGALAEAQAAKIAADAAQVTADLAQIAANEAKAKLADIADDDLVTPIEKRTVLKEWNAIKDEKPLHDAQADKYTVSKVAYGAAYNTLNTYIPPILADMDSNSTIVRTVFMDNFNVYYNERTKLLKAISDKAKDTLDLQNAAILSAANNAQEAKDFIDNILPGQLENIQNQVDGAIESWFYPYAPTLANAPASSWITNAIKDAHLGDLFYDKNTGYGYRFVLDAGVYDWFLLKDTDITLALAKAASAQDTADSKRRVFIVEPYTPYDQGDLWSQGGTGELMRCQVTRLTGAYNAADWVKATKYTDDSTAIEAGLAAGAANAAVAALSSSLGALAFENAIDLAKLDDTIIVGGYIKTTLLDVNAIRITGGLETVTGAQTKINQALTDFDGTLGSLAYDDLVSAAKLDSTVIVGGFIKTSLLDAAYIKSDIINADYIETLGLISNSIKTAASGKRVEILNSSNDIKFYDTGGALRVTIGEDIDTPSLSGSGMRIEGADSTQFIGMGYGGIRIANGSDACLLTSQAISVPYAWLSNQLNLTYPSQLRVQYEADTVGGGGVITPGAYRVAVESQTINVAADGGGSYELWINKGIITFVNYTA